VIGAWGDDDYSGSAYVFHYNGSQWTQQAKLTAPDATVADYFGVSVSISGDTVAIGAFGDDDHGQKSGSAYIFQFDGENWTEQAKLTASDGEANDRFGSSASISGDTVVVGARYDDDNGDCSGSAYIFQFEDGEWIQQAKLSASDGEADDTFGESVSISGDTVVIGALGDDDHGGASGSAYIFQFEDGEWIQQAKLTASDGEVSDHFGTSVSISGDTVLIGASGDDDHGGASGSAYVFDLNLFEDCNGNGIPDDQDIADGTSQDCNGNGIPDICDIEAGTSQDSNENGVPDECDMAPVASRNLPPAYVPGQNLTVTINLEFPDDAVAVALEDAPPAGWTDIANLVICREGVCLPCEGQGKCGYDQIHHQVKWGLFFDPFPESVSYDITPAGDDQGEQCFFGDIAVNGIIETIQGDQCIDVEDCNGNSIFDVCDTDCGPYQGPCDVPGCGQSSDCNENGVPDECEECPCLLKGDVNFDGHITKAELHELVDWIAIFNPLTTDLQEDLLCVADLDEDGNIDFDDLHLLIDLVFEEACGRWVHPEPLPKIKKLPVSPSFLTKDNVGE